MRSWTGAAIASALVALAGCHLYFGDDDDDSTVADAGRRPADASRVPTPDAATPAPDAEQCETVDQFLTRFGECMTYANWQAAGMCDVPNETTASGICSDCHADGTGDIFLSTSCEDTFASTKLQPYILGLVTPARDGEGCFTGFASGSWLTYSDPGHPTYSFTEARAQAINDFFSTTYARYADPDFDCSAP